MLTQKERIIKIIETLPYELETEVSKRMPIDIVIEIARKYVEVYGTDDLTEEDKNSLLNLIAGNGFIKEQEKRNLK